ncbi:MAG: hypothetical protein ACMG6H_02750 [Acidobacteriota bacterium]
MKFSGRPPSRGTTSWLGTAGLLLIVSRLALLEIVFAIARLTIAGLAIAWGKLDLEFVELVPLGFGALTVRNRQKLLQTAAGRNWLLCAHRYILSHCSGRAALPD